MTDIHLTDVRKAFAHTLVLDGLTLDVPDGATTAILGASGSGKSTLLRLIAGFERVDLGMIRIGDVIVDDGTRSVHPQHRGIGYVAQDGALFPHLSVFKNVSFGLARRDTSRAQDLIEMVGLAGLESRYPHQLSGGQQQRVALARALAIRPRVLLLDEPFSSLDVQLRVSVRRDIARILAEAGTTTIMVTHDHDDALSLAEQVVVLDRGRVMGSGAPRDLYETPTSSTIARRLGEVNLLPARILGDRAVCDLGHLAVSPSDSCEGDAIVALRPEQIILHGETGSDRIGAQVRDREYYGHDALVTLELDATGGHTVAARVAGARAPRVGQGVWVSVAGPSHVLVIDDDSIT